VGFILGTKMVTTIQNQSPSSLASQIYPTAWMIGIVLFCVDDGTR
jgi:hypothetical protein